MLTRRFYHLVIFLSVWIASSTMAISQQTWVGLAGDNLWSSPANWDDGLPPANNQIQQFYNAFNPDTVNDVVTQAQSIWFLYGLPISFTIDSPAGLEVDDIQNWSTSPQTLSGNISAPSANWKAVNGDLIFTDDASTGFSGSLNGDHDFHFSVFYADQLDKNGTGTAVCDYIYVFSNCDINNGVIEVLNDGIFEELNFYGSTSKLRISGTATAEEIYGTGQLELNSGNLYLDLHGSSYFYGDICGTGDIHVDPYATGFWLLSGCDILLNGQIDINAEMEFSQVIAHPQTEICLDFGGTLDIFSGSLILGPVLSQPGSEISLFGSTAPFFLGDATSIDGFQSHGEFFIGNSEALLLDADQAELHGMTEISGGRISTLNGLWTGPSGILTAIGNAVIDGKLTNDGEIHGPTSSGMAITFEDDVDGSGSYTGNVHFSDGFSPGNSPATVSLENLMFDSSTSLTIELGGTIAGDEYDQLIVSGDAVLDGSLIVEAIDNFEPGPDQEFLIIDIGGVRTGEFAGLTEGAVVTSIAGQDVMISYSGGDGNDVTLFTAPDVLLGDVNLDGMVNLLDVDHFIDRIGTGTYQAEADCNQDGAVNLLDIDFFIAILGGA